MTTEQQSQLNKIRQRWKLTPYRPPFKTCKDDIDFLLARLDSQAAEGDPVSYYNEDGSYNPVGQNIADHAATAMRSRCVAAVPEVGVTFSNGYEEWEGAGDFRERVITALEALTLEQQEKQ